MSVSLTVIAGPDSGRICALKPGGVLLVGRGAQCDLRLTDPGVSRVHCRLIADGDGVRLEDADSRFGTLVNRRPIAVKSLRPGDTIEIGDTELRLGR